MVTPSNPGSCERMQCEGLPILTMQEIVVRDLHSQIESLNKQLVACNTIIQALQKETVSSQIRIPKLEQELLSVQTKYRSLKNAMDLGQGAIDYIEKQAELFGFNDTEVSDDG